MYCVQRLVWVVVGGLALSAPYGASCTYCVLSISTAFFCLFRLDFRVCVNIFFTSALLSVVGSDVGSVRAAYRAVLSRSDAGAFHALRYRSPGHLPTPCGPTSSSWGWGSRRAVWRRRAGARRALHARRNPPLVWPAPRVGTAAGTRGAWGRATLHEGGCREAAPPWRGSSP